MKKHADSVEPSNYTDFKERMKRIRALAAVRTVREQQAEYGIQREDMSDPFSAYSYVEQLQTKLPDEYKEFVRIAAELSLLVGAVKMNLSGRWPSSEEENEPYHLFSHHAANVAQNMVSFCHRMKEHPEDYAEQYAQMKDKVVGRISSIYPLEEAIVFDAAKPDGGHLKDDRLRNEIASELGEITHLMQEAEDIVERMDPAKHPRLFPQTSRGR